MPSLNTGNAILSNAIAVDSSYNVGIGGAASGSFKLQVTGTSNLTGALTGTSATFSGDLTIDTNTLYVDSTNNRVGIGTASPTAKLEVYGGESNMGLLNISGVYGGIIRFLGSGVNKWGITVEDGLGSDKFGISKMIAIKESILGQTIKDILLESIRRKNEDSLSNTIKSHLRKHLM
jgi:hypothetical protein